MTWPTSGEIERNLNSGEARESAAREEDRRKQQSDDER
jgi:hypothetical protein